MAVSDHVDLEQFMDGVKHRNPGEVEFQQAVYEVDVNVFDFIADKEVYHGYPILRRIAEPDRVVSFRVCWEDDKGGLRFHNSVNQSIRKLHRRGRLTEYAEKYGIEHHAGRPWGIEADLAFTAAKVLFAPSKAANAGGVAVSGLEMSQNSARITWKRKSSSASCETSWRTSMTGASSTAGPTAMST